MTELKKIKFTGVKVDKLLSFLEEADIKEHQVIDIQNGMMVSKGHNVDKTFVKYVDAPLSDLFEKIEVDVAVVIPINDIKKIIELLKIYKSRADINTVNGELQCKVDEQQSRYVACILQFKSTKMSTKVNLGEISMIQYLPTEIWQKLTVTDNYLCKFLATKDDLQSVAKLLKFETDTAKNAVKDIKKFIVDFSSSVTIKSYDKKWDVQCPTADSKLDQSLELVFSNLLIEKMNKSEDYNFYLSMIGSNYCLIVEQQNSSTKYLVAGQKYDINAKF